MEITNADNLYGIVVTYKDHFLKGGAAVWEEFLGEIVKTELDSKKIAHDIMLPGNLFFISVAEFDCLVTYLKNNPQVSLVTVLELVKEREKVPETQAATLIQHLNKMSADRDLCHPPYLRERFEEIPENLKSLFKK